MDGSNTINFLSLAATVVFGILSVVLSVILYRRSKRRKDIGFVYATVQLQTKTHPEVEILFRQQEVLNLSRLRAAFWNNGTEAIRSSDIPRNGALTAVLKGARILSVAYERIRDDTQFEVVHHANDSVVFEFAYLNPGDWGLFEVLYETVAPEGLQVELLASIIGGDSSRGHRRQSRDVADFTTSFLSEFSWLIALLVGMLSFTLTKSFIAKFVQMQRLAVFTEVSISLTVAIGFYVLCRTILRRHTHALVPDPVRPFVEGESNPELHPVAGAAALGARQSG